MEGSSWLNEEVIDFVTRDYAERQGSHQVIDLIIQVLLAKGMLRKKQIRIILPISSLSISRIVTVSKVHRKGYRQKRRVPIIISLARPKERNSHNTKGHAPHDSRNRLYISKDMHRKYNHKGRHRVPRMGYRDKANRREHSPQRTGEGDSQYRQTSLYERIGSTSCVEVFEVLEEPEENIMLVACGCSQRTQRADQVIC